MATRTPAPPADEQDIEPPEGAFVEGTAPDAPDGVDHWIAILQAPTPDSEIKHKGVWANRQPVMNPDGTPKQLAYITARFVQDRLDEAVGPANWQTTFESLPDGSVRAGIGLLVGEGEEPWVWKWDVGVPSNIEPSKGAHSDAFKRAAVQWGIARDLYDERDDKDLEYPMPQPQVAQQQVYQQPQQGQMPPYPANMDAPPNVMPRGAGVPIQQQVQQGQVVQQPYVENGQNPTWVCPIHNDVKVVPGGVSRRTGRAYSAFYACPVPGCDQKGSSV